MAHHTFQFTHYKLVAYQVARDLADLVMHITPQIPRGLRRPGEDLFQAITRRDILLHHPYDSFSPVVDLMCTLKNMAKKKLWHTAHLIAAVMRWFCR